MEPIDWTNVRKVLVVKLRSIGDTVLATPSLAALRRHLPDARIDILLEDWVAPLLEGARTVDNVIPVGRGTLSRFDVMRRIRANRYDVAFNLHGGTTSTFFMAASRARHRVGYREYQYAFLYNHLFSSSADFWGREKTHSAEQQLALLGFAGIPVDDRPASELSVTDAARRSLNEKFAAATGRNIDNFGRFALIHPAAAFATKEWPVENFAAAADHLVSLGLRTVAVAAKHERAVLDALRAATKKPVTVFDDLELPELTALASQADLFVGNDSGIAHIAAAVDTPSVVIFGSSNRDHWRPWTKAPHEIVFQPFECQPCPGYECAVFGEPRCIRGIPPAAVVAAVQRVLEKAKETDVAARLSS